MWGRSELGRPATPQEADLMLRIEGAIGTGIEIPSIGNALAKLLKEGMEK